MPFASSTSFAATHGHGRAPGAGVTAVLGPTNTGKTHLAIERMLAHSSGLIGLPLRLLAREVYNKLVDRAGIDAVALITGEEKIKPKHARYWVSTVEAMPRDLDVSFLAIDEIQIAADLERGHVFTDRILNRRGRDETLILGAATMRGIVERVLPGLNVVTRPRLSQLEFAGDRKITRQPRRTAIVAFSADEVYAIAELIRRQHGGAAVVMGSLSPRTRNAQVAMFQSGEVDYLVATDAIGMGLNLDVDHVAFASDRKYDGYQYRRLNPAEFAQIAGRAGRATRDGTFGTTGRCGPFEPELVNALQNHNFDSVKLLQWRNSALDFSSIGALQAALARTPGHEALTRAPIAEDIRVLDHAARDSDVREMAQGAAAVERLWDICQIPDYRRMAPAAHAELVTTLFGDLIRHGKIPEPWFAAQVAQADRTDGDIDTLSARIAQIRTWTFVANRPDWLSDPEHWQGLTRAVEDKLSDALHERLTERFVDRRTSVLMRRLRENTTLNTEIGKTGEVIVEGHAIGRLDGFMFAPEAAEAGSEAKALQAAAQKALAGEIDARAAKLASAPDDQFVLTSDGTIRWIGDAVGKLMSSDNPLQPRVRLIADDRLSGAPREQVQARIELWLTTHITKLLGPLFEMSNAEDITGIGRGIAFQLVEALGVIERQKIASEMKDLDQASRATLRKYGIRFGAYHIYVPALLKPAARALASLLWALRHDNADLAALSGAQHLAGSGRTSFPVDKALDQDAYRTLGYRVCGERAVRVDILERLADLIRPALSWREGSSLPKPGGAFDGRSFTVTQAMTSLTGSAGEDFASVLRALGYRMEKRPPLPTPPEPAPQAADTSSSEAAPAEAAIVDGATASDAAAASDRVVEAAVHAAFHPEPSADIAGQDNTVAETSLVTDDASAPALSAETSQPAPEDVATGPAEPIIVVEPAGDAGAVAADVAPADAYADKIEATEQTPQAESAGEGAAPASAEVETETTPAAPELIEVWRPAGRSDERRPRPNFTRHRQARHAGAQGEGAQGDAGTADQPRRERHRGRRGRGQDFHKPQPGADQAAASGAATEQAGATHAPGAGDGAPNRGGRPPFPGREGRNRPHGKGHKGGHGRPDQRHQDQRHGGGGQPRDGGQRQPPRDRPIDPNSPFAKLAALKAQLEMDAKSKR
jgi:ATP-dependent RNA helicase SUPV3L1/SUV3